MAVHILALDFDGVICDSAGECLFTSYSYYAPIAGLPSAPGLDEIPEGLRKKFYRIRPFIQDGKDYMLILYFITNGIPIEGQEDFDQSSRDHLDRVCQEVGAADAKQLEELFQRKRREIRTRNETAWLGLNPLYRELEEGLLACQERFDRIYVTTSKPTDAVVEILAHHRIPLPENHIYGYDKVETGRGKNGHLKKVHQLTGTPFEEIHLVDDQLSHLKAARQLGANCYHASWGYTTDQQRQEADAAGIASLKQEAMAGWMTQLLRRP